MEIDCVFFKTAPLKKIILTLQLFKIRSSLTTMTQAAFLTQIEFFALLGSALIVSFIPYVRRPFLWAETFFHEISHGFMAAATGGRIAYFKINFDGSGYCRILGGWNILTCLAGYLGASVWGALIFLAARNSELSQGIPLAEILCAFIIICHLLWAKGLSSYITGFTVCIALYTPTILPLDYANHITALFGLHVCINAIKAPFELWYNPDKGDARELARTTLIPSYFWILAWGIFSSYTIYWLWQQS